MSSQYKPPFRRRHGGRLVASGAVAFAASCLKIFSIASESSIDAIIRITLMLEWQQRVVLRL
ncbi:MAG: hypothetical protein WBM41_07785 [Arenicellales bacterium]